MIVCWQFLNSHYFRDLGFTYNSEVYAHYAHYICWWSLELHTNFTLLIQQAFGLIERLLHLIKLRGFRVAVSPQTQQLQLHVWQLPSTLTHLWTQLPEKHTQLNITTFSSGLLLLSSCCMYVDIDKR